MSRDLSIDKFTTCFTDALKCPDIQTILRFITRPTQQELKDMLCDELQQQLQPLRDALKKKDEEITELKKTVAELRSEMDRLELHGRRGNSDSAGNLENDAPDDNADALLTLYDRKALREALRKGELPKQPFPSNPSLDQPVPPQEETPGQKISMEDAATDTRSMHLQVFGGNCRHNLIEQPSFEEEVAAGEWRCAACTYLNHGGVITCDVCQMHRARSSTVQQEVQKRTI